LVRIEGAQREDGTVKRFIKINGRQHVLPLDQVRRLAETLLAALDEAEAE
jgi:hypothetical protein